MMSVGRTVVLLNAIFLLQACSSGTPSPGADLVFTNGAVYTVNDQQPWASAVAVSDGRIVYVGDDAGVESHIGTQTRVISLAGKMLMPGFIDSHMHPMAAGTRFLRCQLNDLEWPDEVLVKIEECVAGLEKQQWLRAVGLASEVLEDKDPGLSALDAVSPDNPLFISADLNRSVFVNSFAMDAAGIDDSTPDPSKGIIERDSISGQATGVLRNEAVSLVYNLIPAPDTDVLRISLRMASEMANSFGIISSNEASMLPAHHQAYLEAEAAGEMTIRIQGSQRWDPDLGLEQLESIVELRDSAAGGMFTADSVKFFLDGSGNRTGALLEPYVGTSNDFGKLDYGLNGLSEIVQELDAQGFQMHMHAYGDRAVRMGLDAIEYAIHANGPKDRRHQMAHLALIDSSDLHRFAELGITANIQALWAYLGEERLMEVESLGKERAIRFLAFNSLFESGARVAAGSDWISESMNPLFSIQVAVTRRPPDGSGEAWIPEQRVTLEQMIEAYTINGAWLARLENETGSIEVGKAADLVVLERNLFESDPMKLKDVKILLTLLEGEEVYRHSGF